MQMSATTLGKPGTAEIGTPWEELGFEFLPTNSHVRITYKDGEWGPTELVKVSFFKLKIDTTRRSCNSY